MGIGLYSIDFSDVLLFVRPKTAQKPKIGKVEISGPQDFTHVQHFGPHQQINLQKMPVSVFYIPVYILDAHSVGMLDVYMFVCLNLHKVNCKEFMSCANATLSD